MKKMLFVISVSLLLFSCATTKSLNIVNLNEGNVLYGIESGDIDNDLINESVITTYKSRKGARVKLNLSNTELTLEAYDLDNDFEVDRFPLDRDIGSTEGKLMLLDAFSASKNVGESVKVITAIDESTGHENSFAFESTDFDDTDLRLSNPLRYSDNKLVFQTLTIPFKIRGRQGDVPSTVATNFNAGIAYGYQWNLSKVHPIYGQNEAMVGYELEKITFSLAPFAGLTTMALSAGNTEPDILVDQTVLGYSVGLAGVFSFNRLNLGLAFGIDHGFGRAKDWIYQDKLWTGIVIGLDLIK